MMTKKPLKPKAVSEPCDSHPEFDDARMADLKQWAFGYWLADYKHEHPGWSADKLRRKAQAAAERDPITLGFFLPREERDRLLAQGLDHFEIETYTMLKYVRSCRCRRGA